MSDALHDFLNGKGKVPSHLHENGGGWVADTACVQREVYVGPDAEVFDTARVYGDVAIIDSARVYGNSEVKGFPLPHDLFRRTTDLLFPWVPVEKKTIISGSVKIHGNTKIYAGTEISGNAELSFDGHFGQAIEALS